MIIKQIKTQHVTSNPFASIINPEYLDTFVPYYTCEIATDTGTYRGTGETEYAAEQDAMSNLRHSLSLEADKALEQYNVKNGAGMLDIA